MSRPERPAGPHPSTPCLPQAGAEALDALAGLLQRRCRRGVGDAEVRAEPERGSLHHRNPFCIKQFGDEILVGADLVAGRRQLADGAGAGRIDVERPLRLRDIGCPSPG